MSFCTWTKRKDLYPLFICHSTRLSWLQCNIFYDLWWHSLVTVCFYTIILMTPPLRLQARPELFPVFWNCNSTTAPLNMTAKLQQTTHPLTPKPTKTGQHQICCFSWTGQNRPNHHWLIKYSFDQINILWFNYNFPCFSW